MQEINDDLDITDILSIIEKTPQTTKGHKKCQSCNRINGVRSKECECGYLFEAPKKTAVISNVASRGRKQCKCGAFIGVKNTICPQCNQKFENKNNINMPPSAPISKYVGGRIVVTPSGPTPIKVHELSQESINEWCEEILEIGRLQNTTYSYEAMIYWLRDSFNIHEDDYCIAKQYVLNWNKECERSQKKSDPLLSLLEEEDVISAEND